MIFKRLKSNSTSSKRWLDRQQKDVFTQQSKILNYKSRAAFKLIEINEKYRIFNHKCTNIVDLGYAPGSWSQVAMEEMKKKNINPQIVGIDLIRCSPPKGVKFIQGDFLNPSVHQQITEVFNNSPIQLILSDMMTNTTGMKQVDHLGSMDLCNAAIQLSNQLLAKNGNMVIKFFMGHEQKLVETELREKFHKVYQFKPRSSRNESREMYFVALRKKIGEVSEP